MTVAFDRSLGIDVAGERQILLLHERRELLTVDDPELAALDELRDEHVLHRRGAAVVPPLTVRLVLELEHRDAGLRIVRRLHLNRRDQQQQCQDRRPSDDALHDLPSLG